MTKITSLGHAGMIIESEKQAVLIDPWRDNPLFPHALRSRIIPEDVVLDAVLVTHGHNSHLGSSLEIAREYQCPVFSVNEVSLFLKLQGLAADQSIGLNVGGTVDFGQWEATLVWAAHSCSCNDSRPAEMLPGGAACGWVIKTPEGETIYHAGDTAVTSEMKIVNDLYAPSVAILPIGGHYCMGPRGAAYCVNQLLPCVSELIPWSSCFAMTSFPVRKGTVAEVAPYIERPDVRLVDLAAGESVAVGSPAESAERNDAAAVALSLRSRDSGQPVEGIAVEAICMWGGRQTAFPLGRTGSDGTLTVSLHQLRERACVQVACRIPGSRYGTIMLPMTEYGFSNAVIDIGSAQFAVSLQ